MLGTIDAVTVVGVGVFLPAARDWGGAIGRECALRHSFIARFDQGGSEKARRNET
jgi:hypothetical protein